MCFVREEMLTLASWPVSRISNYILAAVVNYPLLLQLDMVFFSFSQRAVELCYWRCYLAVSFQLRGPSISVINEVFSACKRLLECSLGALHKSINNRCT